MILRTYGCPECGHTMTLELRSDQWDQPPPDCPRCSQQTEQEFVPVAIGGSVAARATDMALDIAAKDYNVADIHLDHREGSKPRVRYRDADPASASTWGAQGAALQQAIALGRENRLRYGSGLDVLQSALKSGSQPDLIELSKRRSARLT